MSSIEINTSQNVTIEYELAHLKDRALAFLLDFLIMLGSIFILLLVSIAVFGTDNADYFFYLIAVPIFFFYTLVSEIINDGKSIGKSAMKIQVIKLSGKEPSINDYLTRWVFRMVDIYFSLGSVASFLISSSGKGQRLGDILANTTVIKLRPDYSLELSDLVNRAAKESYQPQYPEVRKFKEEDMLVVKSMIDRYRQYPNQAHQEALKALTEKIAEQLSLKEIPKNRVEFLKTLLKDYIILTR